MTATSTLPSLGSPATAIRAILTDADEPLTASDVSGRLIRMRYRWPHPSRFELPHYDRVHSMLKSMERRGQVRRIHIPDGAAQWELVL